MSQHNQKIGRWGEQIAADYLAKKGYEVLERNARTPYGELDLIVMHNGGLVVVEVKTRTTTSYGYPETAISARKQEHLAASAEHYAQEHNIDHWQIDAISVEGKPNGGAPKITHFEDIL
jgi:putative endonuclease